MADLPESIQTSSRQIAGSDKRQLRRTNSKIEGIILARDSLRGNI